MANFNFNKIMLGGRLTADPENKQTPAGVSVTAFTVAVNRRGAGGDTGEQKADFFKVIAWRALADFVARFFKKGASIFVVGELRNRSYVDHEGTKRYVTEILASEISFVDSRGESVSSAAEGAERPAPLSGGFATAEDFAAIGDDDDLPF